MNGPVLKTDRLELWKPALADVNAMIEIVSHPETGRYLGRTASRADHFTRIQRNAGSWLLHGYGGFMVRERGRSAVIGNCGIFHSFRGLGDDFDDMPEAGWILAHDKGGMGYAREAMRAALEWFEQEHGRQPIVCMIDPDNAPSISLAGKLGFVEMRGTELADGAPIILYLRDPQ